MNQNEMDYYEMSEVDQDAPEDYPVINTSKFCVNCKCELNPTVKAPVCYDCYFSELP